VEAGSEEWVELILETATSWERKSDTIRNERGCGSG